MASEIDKGILIEIKPTEQKTEKFRKREFTVLLEEGRFSKKMPYQLLNDKCGLLDNFKEGQLVTVYSNRIPFEIEKPSGEIGRYVNLDCWKIEASK